MNEPDATTCVHPTLPFELDTEHAERASALFRALGDRRRLELLYQLWQAGEACVSELVVEGQGMSTVSQRLKVLHQERIVTRERRGKHIYYRLADDHVIGIIRDALDHVGEV